MGQFSNSAAGRPGEFDSYDPRLKRRAIAQMDTVTVALVICRETPEAITEWPGYMNRGWEVLNRAKKLGLGPNPILPS